MSTFDLDCGDPASPYSLDKFSLSLENSDLAGDFGPAGPVQLKSQPSDFHFERSVNGKSLVVLLVTRKHFDSVRLRIFKEGALKATLTMRDFNFVSGGTSGGPRRITEEHGDATFADATATVTVADDSDTDVGPGDE